MRFIREIGEKGQVVIPVDIRHMLGLMPRQRVVFEVQNNEVTMKQENNAEQAMKEFLKHRKKGKSLTLKDLKKIEEESYDLP